MNKNILTGPNRYDKTLKPNLPSCQLWENIWPDIYTISSWQFIITLNIFYRFRYDLNRQVERWKNHIKNRVDISRVYNWNGQYLTKANSTRCSPQKGVVFFNFIKFRSMWQLIYGAKKQKGLNRMDIHNRLRSPIHGGGQSTSAHIMVFNFMEITCSTETPSDNHVARDCNIAFNCTGIVKSNLID
jgi:hypothetical protein